MKLHNNKICFFKVQHCEIGVDPATVALNVMMIMQILKFEN